MSLKISQTAFKFLVLSGFTIPISPDTAFNFLYVFPPSKLTYRKDTYDFVSDKKETL